MTISKRDAMQLVADIRRAKVSGHAIAARTGGDPHAAMAGFMGGLEAVLQHFLRLQGCGDAAAALGHAMNDAPTDGEVAERNATIARFRSAATGSAA